MNFILENWLAIISTISIPIAWIFGGKQAKKVEIKNSNGDFLTKVQGIYDGLVEDLKTDRDELKACNVEQSKDIADLRNDVGSLEVSATLDYIVARIKDRYLPMEEDNELATREL